MDRRNFIGTGAAAILAAMAPQTAAGEMASAAPAVVPATGSPLWNMMSRMVEPAHTVCATGGMPSWTALNCVCEALEGHKQKVKAIVAHPDMISLLEAMQAGKVKVDGEMPVFSMAGRTHQEIRHDDIKEDGTVGKITYGPVIHVEQRHLQLIVEEGAQKDTILLLSDLDKFTRTDDDGAVSFNPMGMGKVVVSGEAEVEVKAY